LPVFLTEWFLLFLKISSDQEQPCTKKSIRTEAQFINDIWNLYSLLGGIVNFAILREKKKEKNNLRSPPRSSFVIFSTLMPDRFRASSGKMTWCFSSFFSVNLMFSNISELVRICIKCILSLVSLDRSISRRKPASIINITSWSWKIRIERGSGKLFLMIGPINSIHPPFGQKLECRKTTR